LRFVVCVGQGASGPSDQQIEQQIDALNEGFAGANRCVNSEGADFTVYTPDFAILDYSSLWKQLNVLRTHVALALADGTSTELWIAMLNKKAGA
jgi:hypothetical protein